MTQAQEAGITDAVKGRNEPLFLTLRKINRAVIYVTLGPLFNLGCFCFLLCKMGITIVPHSTSGSARPTSESSVTLLLYFFPLSSLFCPESPWNRPTTLPSATARSPFSLPTAPVFCLTWPQLTVSRTAQRCPLLPVKRGGLVEALTLPGDR